MSAGKVRIISIVDISMSLLGRFGADGRVASIVFSLAAADHLVAGVGAATAQS